MNLIENKNQIEQNNNPLTEENIKLEQLNNIYLSLFKSFKKTKSKSNSNNQELKHFIQEL